MTQHATGTRQEWLAARLELLDAEKELTRRSDELARQRQELPWVRLDKQYRFDTDEGSASLADLFRGRSQLLVYHFMFGPDYAAGCPGVLGDRGRIQRLRRSSREPRRDAVGNLARALQKLQAFKRRMGWSFPWASSFGSDFNNDFDVAVHAGAAARGNRRIQLPPDRARRADPRIRNRRRTAQGVAEMQRHRCAHVYPRKTRHECVRTRRRRRPSPRIPRTRADSTACGARISGSTALRWDATSRASGGATMTSTATAPATAIKHFSASLRCSSPLSAATTIVWCASMSAMGGMPMPGGWTMSMAWMRMPGSVVDRAPRRCSSACGS